MVSSTLRARRPLGLKFRHLGAVLRNTTNTTSLAACEKCAGPLAVVGVNLHSKKVQNLLNRLFFSKIIHGPVLFLINCFISFQRFFYAWKHLTALTVYFVARNI